jgi:glycerol-3-phosphate dehydrogenase (NAD(P)+)
MSRALTGDARIGVIGAGAWGTALATMLAAGGTPVVLWSHGRELADEIATTRLNPRYLPGAPLARDIIATGDLAHLAHLPVLLVVCPAQHVGEVLSGLPVGEGPRDLVLCAKGIEAGTGRLMADVARAACPGDALAVLSGPTLRAKWRWACPPRSRWPVKAGRSSGSACRRCWPVRRSGLITPMTSSGPRSAGR